jgi:DNA modification methylase
MTPTWSSECGSVELYHADALHVMASLDTASLDAVTTDPPYCSGSVSEAQRTQAAGQGLRSDTIRRLGWFTGDNMGTAGLTWLLRSIAVESRRVMRDSASLLAFCDWRMLSTLQPAIESAGLRYQNLVVWDKTHMGLGSGFRCRHELVMHFTNGKPQYHDRGTANVIDCKRVGSTEREHQTQKPVGLMTALLNVVCPPGGIVCDPFMGSATTGVACVNTGRRFIGIEQTPEHFETARARIEKALAERAELLVA